MKFQTFIGLFVASSAVLASGPEGSWTNSEPKPMVVKLGQIGSVYKGSIRYSNGNLVTIAGKFKDGEISIGIPMCPSLFYDKGHDVLIACGEPLQREEVLEREYFATLVGLAAYDIKNALESGASLSKGVQMFKADTKFNNKWAMDRMSFEPSSKDSVVLKALNENLNGATATLQLSTDSKGKVALSCKTTKVKAPEICARMH